MRVLELIVLCTVMFCIMSLSAIQSEGLQEKETILDRKVHLEQKIILDIPQVPRFCEKMNIEKKRVNIGDCELYCGIEGAGMPIVLLHGGPGATHHYFHPYFSQAKGFAKIIYYDQRGCGLSDYEPGEGYTVDQAANDLENLRKALKIEKWIVLGHSYGGLLAQYYTQKYPDNIAGLVLVGSSLAMQVSLNPTRQFDFMSKEERAKIKEIRAKAANDELTVGQNIFNAFLNGDWKRQCYYKPSRERIAQIALYEWQHDKNFNQIMSIDSDKIDLKGAFNNCPIPTLIIEGKWDLTWNTDKPEKLHQNHPGSQLIMFENSSHNPFEDEPEKFFSLLKSFVSDLKDIPGSDLKQWKEYLITWRAKK
jgi:proline iminopeptidase